MNREQHTSSRRCSQKGFTLLELLLTIAILALMVGIMGGALRLAIRSWEKGEEAVDEFRKTRIVMDMVAQQIKSIYPYWINKEEKWTVAFEGGSKTLKFVTPISLTSPMISGLVWVQYALGEEGASENGKSLTVRESMITGGDFFQELSEDTNVEGSDVPLLSGLDDITFDYYILPPDSDEGEWRENWDEETEEDTKLPYAVRIKLTHTPKKPDEGEPMTTAMTIPIMVAPLDQTSFAQGRPGAGPASSPFGFFPKPSLPPVPTKHPKGGSEGTISTPFGELPAPPGAGSGSPPTPFGHFPVPPEGGSGSQSSPFGR